MSSLLEYVEDPANAEFLKSVTKLSVSAVSTDAQENSPEAYLWAVTVEARGHGNWSVSNGGYVYDKNGKDDYEPMPSSRTDAFLNRFRFSLPEAIRIAEKVAPKITINGKNAAAFSAWWENRSLV